METLYIVMPAYNEEDNIENVVEQWYPILEGKSDDSRLVIADSGSSDRTHEILMNLKEKKYHRLRILDTSNQYHGPKLIALYEHAINMGADYIFQTDSDGQTDPDEFDAFWRDRKNYDGIFGNRTVRGDGKDRAFVEQVVCLMLKVFFKVDTPDANAPFRLMKADSVRKYLNRMPSDYALPNIMLVAFFLRYKEKVSFKEISFKPRMYGKNSIDFYKIFKIGIKSCVDFFRFRKMME